MERPNGNGMFGFSSGMGFLYPLRCDRGVAHLNTKGCVFPAAAAVYVLSRKDDTVKEAAEHILEAQTGPLQSPGKFLRRPGTRAMADQSVMGGAALQRAKSETVRKENRAESCGTKLTSLIKTRQPLSQSSACAAGTVPCECDEYPFAATWSGGRFSPEHTSVKRISRDHNQAAGGGKLSGFFRTERVLDFTQYPEQIQPYDPSAESNRGGDDFWVYVK